MGANKSLIASVTSWQDNATLVGIVSTLVSVVLLVILLADVPMAEQVLFSLFFIFTGILLWLKKSNDQVRLSLIVLSVTASLRYIFWRGTHTLNFNTCLDALVSLALYAAESYIVLILIINSFQLLQLNRSYDEIQPEPSYMPSVDIFVPTYNESVDILRRTICGAQAIAYFNKKIYVLDDGHREEMKRLANELGCNYISRLDNVHAKAGNINNALKKTKGELIVIFDADFIPSPDFLQHTVHFFKDPKLALVQTPHRFMNPAPVERNLYLEGVLPQEGELFYQLVQVGNNNWNAAFFCGSAAVIRRSVLEEIGGIAVETVTEDCHTSMKMHALGYKSIFISIPLSVGLSPESFSGYVIQRTRWARGMAQILRLDNPLFKKGLTWPQRLCYFSGMIHFLFGVPRLIFLLAPLAYLLFNLHPFQVAPANLLVMFVPHLLLANLSSNYQYHNFRHSYWSEVYETVMAPYAAYATTLALLNPKAGKFNVTPKGIMSDKPDFDLKIAWPLLICFVLCLLGLFAVPMKLAASHDYAEKVVTGINAFWASYNFLLILAALLIALERPYYRRTHRIPRGLSILLALPGSNNRVSGISKDINEYGMSLILDNLQSETAPFQPDQSVVLSFSNPSRGAIELKVDGIVRRIEETAKGEKVVAIEFTNLSAESTTSLIHLAYTDQKTWSHFSEPFDSLYQSYWNLISTPVRVAWKTWHSRRT
jgi:cellulose synthase (UDP-forming)